MAEPLSCELLLERGYCCDLGCQNCPYRDEEQKQIACPHRGIIKFAGLSATPCLDCDWDPSETLAAILKTAANKGESDGT